MTFGTYVTVSGQDIQINTEAVGSEYVVSIGLISAEVKAGPLKIGGSMKKFGITADGAFVTQPGFGVQLSLDEASPDSFKWPKWLPIRLTELGIEWKDIQNNPSDFALILSAKVTGIPGVPLNFEGTVNGMRLDMGLLQQGKFPITDLESIAVKAGGNFGGGEVSGTLLGGILRLDANGNMIDTFDRDTPVADRVLFIGLEGKLFILNKGVQIRFAFSELGPLGVLVSVRIPLLIEPMTGLTIDEMTGGIEFFQSLPTITEPEELRGAAFAPATNIDTSTWLTQVKRQVVNQVKALKANPNMPGFLAAFTSPMTITAAATISSTHLGSAESFNARLELRLSTDGKIFGSGLFRFMNNRLKVSAKIYADLSQVTKGNAKILFLGEAPVIEDQPDLKFLVLKGKFEMRFLNANGQQMNFGTATSEKPSANIVNPGSGSVIGLKKLTDQGYIDVSFQQGASPLDLTSITDAESEFLLKLPDGTTVEITSVPVKVTNATEPHVYRYQLPAGTNLTAGDYTVSFIQDSFKGTDNKKNDAEHETFKLALAEGTLSAPKAGAQIDLLTLNSGGFLTMRFIPLPGAELDPASITDAAAEFVLSGAAAQGVTIGQNPQKVDDFTWKYPFTGQFGTGAVTVTFGEGGFKDKSGNGSQQTAQVFNVVGPVISLMSPAIEVGVLNAQGYLDFWVDGSQGGTVNPESLLDPAAEFTITGDAVGNVIFNGQPEQLSENSYRYFFTGAFSTGVVSFHFGNGTFNDSNGISSVAETELLTVTGAAATLIYPNTVVLGNSVLSQRGYFDIAFTPTSGSSLNIGSILDSGLSFACWARRRRPCVSAVSRSRLTNSPSGTPLTANLTPVRFCSP
jgi:hypothetical protein